MTPHPLKRFQAIRRAFGPATHVGALPSLLGLTGLVAEAHGPEAVPGSGGATPSNINRLGDDFGPGGPSGLNNPAYTHARNPKGSGEEIHSHTRVGKLSPLSPSSPKNKINPLITNETVNLKTAVFQALSLSPKPVKPNGQIEETTGGAVVKPKRNILSIRGEDQRVRHAEFLEAERQRMARVMAAAKLVAGAVPPAQCGGRIIPAPGRGAFRVEPQAEMVPNGTDARGQDKWAEKEGGFAGWNPIRQMDVFDLMEASARRRNEPVPFSPAQIAVARHYRALVERHDAGGIKCSALDGRAAGGGAGRDFMDAFLDEGHEIDAIRRRIGAGVAMAVRRVRPSARGGADRRGIPDRALVDMVCLGDRSLSDVLRAHGWQADGRNRQSVREALSGALDRMIGYHGQKSS